VHCDSGWVCDPTEYPEWVSISKPTDQEYSSLPHIVVKLDSNWDPTLLESEFDPEVEWQDTQEEDEFLTHALMIMAIIFL